MKTSDEELVKRINTVFEDYDDGFSENGWTELRKKYPEKENRKLPIWWLTGIAATLLVVVGLYFNQTFETEKVILKANTSKKDTLSKQIIEKNETPTGLASVSKTIITEKGRATDKEAQKDRNFSERIIVAKQPFTVAQQKPVVAVSTVKKIDNSNNTITENQPKSPAVIDNGVAIASVQTEHKNVEKNTAENNGISIENNKKPENETKATKLTTEEFLKEQSKMLAANEKKKDTKKTNVAKTTIDVFTGTFFNYHDNNEAKLSAGAGLNANVKVTKNLVLSFGAGISQNKVSYENQVPAQVSDAMFAAKNTMLSAAPISGASYSATATNDVSFNGRMLSIDLPMVIKLYPTSKQDFYISTGINSSTYLSQKYTYNYSLSNFSVQNGTAQPQEQTEKSSLKGFDFANSAIIAIGINQNIGKNILIFEPYYKPALSAMGDKNLRISSAGLNLKFNFNGNVKK